MAHKEEKKIEELCKEILEVCRKGLDEIGDVKCTVDKIWARLNSAQSATLTFENEQGDPMPATIPVGGTATAVFTEFAGPNGTGAVVPPSGPITYASDNVAVATVDDAGLVTGVGPGTANISGLDPASPNQVTASDVATVTGIVPVEAVSATMNLTANQARGRR